MRRHLPIVDMSNDFGDIKRDTGWSIVTSWR